jgi:diacylglycerol kinase
LKRRRLFEWQRTLRSFRYAGRGLTEALAAQPNLRIHFLVAVFVFAFAGVLGFSAVALALVALTAGLVLVAELFNTTLEALMDRLAPEVHPLVAYAKDVSAAAVLIAAVAAVLVAVLLFGRRLLGGAV